VAKVILAMPNRDIPLAILPFGTANNIARSLGVVGSLVDLSETWTLDRLGTFNIGIARGPWGERGFVKGFGAGPFAKTLEIDPGGEGAEQLQAGRQVLSEMMRKAEPLDLEVSLDGVPLGGSLLSLEVTNIAYIGPGLPLAPDADPADKALEVVAVEEERREKMVSWLEAPRDAPPVLRGRGRRISLRTKGASLRLDDDFLGAPEETQDITIEFGWSIKILKGHC
jgi:diacylglycerol kinase family enzyme